MRLLATRSTIGPFLGSLVILFTLVDHSECKVAHSLPGWVPKDVKDALKEMKKEQKATKHLLSDHTCALRKSLIELLEEVPDKDVGLAKINLMAELGLCSWWRDEHYLAAERFQRAIDLTGFKKFKQFIDHGLGHIIEASNASNYMVEGKFESAALHLRALKRLMLRDEAWALDEVLRKPPMDQLKPHERELVKSNPGDFLLNNTYVGVVYRGWTVAAKQQLRFCEANLIGLDEGRLAKRERMGGETDNTAYLQGVAAEPVMPWRSFQLPINLYERREELLKAARKGKTPRRPKAAELMGRAGIRGGDCPKYSALCDLLLGYETPVLVDASTYVAGMFNSIIQLVPMNGSKTTQEVGSCSNNAGLAMAFPLNDSEDPDDPIMLTTESVDLPGIALSSEPVVVDPCSDPKPAITRSGGSRDVVYVLVVEFWHPAVTLYERVAIIEGSGSGARKGRESIRVQEVTNAMMDRLKETESLWPKVFDLYQHRRSLSPLGPDELVEDEVIEYPRPKNKKSKKRTQDPPEDSLEVTNLKQLVKKLKAERKAAIKTASAKEVANMDDALDYAEERLDDAIEAQTKSRLITDLEEKLTSAKSVEQALHMTGDLSGLQDVEKQIAEFQAALKDAREADAIFREERKQRREARMRKRQQDAAGDGENPRSKAGDDDDENEEEVELYDVDEEQLKTIFSTVGPVVSFRLMHDKVTGRPKGYGFCEYADQETAYAAMRNLNNVECGGRPLRVDWADHELRNTEGVQRSIQRSGADVGRSNVKVNNKKLREFQQRLTDENAEHLALDVQTHSEIAALLDQWSTVELYQFLGHSQKFVSDNPEGARALFVAHPQLPLAINHVAYLLGFTSEPTFPMTPDDMIYAEERIKALRQHRVCPVKPIQPPRAVPISLVTDPTAQLQAGISNPMMMSGALPAGVLAAGASIAGAR
ncbi:Cleavage stimulation factor subunit 2 [Perkinsus olseni]|uniref:Cleavage stimulation factor subunit 2 n=2 Tax=Perkinsus olseni TaxID=32597 RepID=A0A7J6MVD6_PEROL|nr:Cleavage stimulation factor subunit 2 [Perkinsus olseni]